MTRYVVGFMFNDTKDKVVLIRKNRPNWQKGKLNGVGGHIEEKGYDFEDSIEAMIREFYEETGKQTKEEDWDFVGFMYNSDFECFVFRAFTSDFSDIRTCTDEEIVVCDVDKLDNCLSNLRWLIPMCLDMNPGGGEYEVKVHIRNGK